MMQAPVLSGNVVERIPAHKKDIALVKAEAQIRKTAYAGTSIQTNESFFDDSDLSSGYSLLMVYQNTTKTALLTARYYFDTFAIEKYLKGDSNTLLTIQEKAFLIDRMCAHKTSTLYQKHRSYFHLLFYLELLKRNRNCIFYAMARREEHERLLAKYQRLNMQVVGLTQHKGKEHWILKGHTEKTYQHIKKSVGFGLLFLSKKWMVK